MTIVKKRTTEFAIAIGLFVFLLAATPIYLTWWHSDALPIEFFEVKQMYISDYTVGDQPIVSYERVIRRPFLGEWSAEIQVVGDGVLYAVPGCKGVGRGHYTPQKTLPPKIDMEWLVGAKCDTKLSAGKYRVEITWTLKVPNYPEMEYSFVSNVFEVKTP